MKKPFFWLFLLILVGAFVVRLYKLDLPLADHHSWRQADTAAVARNFVRDGFDFFRPRIDNMTFLQSPQLLNPERFFFTEPPLYNSLVAGVYSFFGVQERWARLVAICFSLGSLSFIFLLVKKNWGPRPALLSAFFFAFLPYGIFYSRTILPEPLMVFLSLGMIFFFQLWLEKGSFRFFLPALIFTALALTQKAFPLFLGLAMAYLVFAYWGFPLWWKKKQFFSLFIFLLFAALPVVGWRWWISHFPEGIPPYDWLFNQGNLRFRPAFFRWIFFERLGKLIFGVWGLPLFLVGVSLKPVKKGGWLFHFWLLSFLVYVAVLATGNITHDYYQIPFLPVAAVFMGLGTDYLLFSAKKDFSRFCSWLAVAACVVFGLGFSWYQVREFYFLQGGVDLAGKAVDQLTPKDALVLTGDSNDATLLYNCNRHGLSGGYASYFPNVSESIDKAKKLGIQYYVTTQIGGFKESDFGRYLNENFKLIGESDQYLIYDLR